MTAPWDDRYVVYRIANSHGFWLYIGSTRVLANRMEQHRRKATPWASDIAHVTVTLHADRRSAYDAEMEAIAVLRPRYNIAGRGARCDWDLVDYLEVIDALERRAAGERLQYPNNEWPGRIADAKLGRVVNEFAIRFPDHARLIGDRLLHERAA